MDAEEILVGGAIGLNNVFGSCDFFVEEKFVEQAEFLRGENMCSEIEVIARVINDFKREHGFSR